MVAKNFRFRARAALPSRSRLEDYLFLLRYNESVLCVRCCGIRLGRSGSRCFKAFCAFFDAVWAWDNLA